MITKFKQIIAAFVPSESSRTALKHAHDIATRHQAELNVLIVNSRKTDIETAKSEIESILEGATYKYEIVEKEGKPFREILNLEKANDADLIIMGTHGSGSRDPEWIGGNAFKVLSGSNCPVITFTPQHKGLGFKNIILPIADASETRQKVPLTVSIAKAYNATVHIAIVNKNEDASVINTLKIYAAQAEGYCIDNNVDFTIKEIYNKNISTACIDYAHEVGADLISIMSERESPTGFFMGHYAQQLVNKSDISTLTIHVRNTKIAGGGGY
jgi:nucleotide-binding universal stress UspA family protein